MFLVLVLMLSSDVFVVTQILREVLPSGMTIPSAFESVGHIAHLNLRDEHTPYRHVIAQVSTCLMHQVLYLRHGLVPVSFVKYWNRLFWRKTNREYVLS